MRILIVEDEPRLAEALGQIMTEQKYASDIVYDGEDGLAYALDGSYDVIVLDVMLPKRNGFDVVRSLRAAKTPLPSFSSLHGTRFRTRLPASTAVRMII